MRTNLTTRERAELLDIVDGYKRHFSSNFYTEVQAVAFIKNDLRDDTKPIRTSLLDKLNVNHLSSVVKELDGDSRWYRSRTIATFKQNIDELLRVIIRDKLTVNEFIDEYYQMYDVRMDEETVRRLIGAVDSEIFDRNYEEKIKANSERADSKDTNNSDDEYYAMWAAHNDTSLTYIGFSKHRIGNKYVQVVNSDELQEFITRQKVMNEKLVTAVSKLMDEVALLTSDVEGLRHELAAKGQDETTPTAIHDNVFLDKAEVAAASSPTQVDLFGTNLNKVIADTQLAKGEAPPSTETPEDAMVKVEEINSAPQAAVAASQSGFATTPNIQEANTKEPFNWNGAASNRYANYDPYGR